MIGRKVRKGLISFLLLLLLVLFLDAPLQAQASTGTLRGQITDPSGASVGNATVVLAPPVGQPLTAPTNKDGFYEFKNLLPGTYALKAAAPGFASFINESVEIVAGQVQKLNIALSIEVQRQKVEVDDAGNRVELNPANNISMIVLNGKDMDALSDDPDQLQADLQALAGPSAGPNGGQIYIDGFTGGTLPPKASIREIRINQNPFSAEYDRLGYGRIEILTKPGTDQFHGEGFISGNSSAFNSRNPFSVQPGGILPPGYESTQFSASAGGPLGKKASLFFNLERRDIHDLSVIDARILDQDLNFVPFSAGIPNPRTRLNLSPRLDYQVTQNNTLTVRYQFERENETNNGIGQFALASQGLNARNTEHNIQLSDTQIINSKIINETRFRFVRETAEETPQSIVPSIAVQDTFVGGGNTSGRSADILDRYELQNYTSMSVGKHFLKFGLRLRVNHDDNVTLPNSNGSFTFGSRRNPACALPNPPAPCGADIPGFTAYQLTVQGLKAGTPLAAIIASGGGASQYVVATGTARATVSYVDAGPYFQDDWRLRRNITFSYGLRVESQNNIGDHADLAPRFGLAWGLGGGGKNGSPKTVLRAGYGIFYDRFSYDLVLRQERLNGAIQRQFTFANPNFFLDPSGNAPLLSTLLQNQQPAAIAPTIYRTNPGLRTPYTMQTGFSLERQLTKNATLALTYLNARGVHQFFTENINAPLCTSFPCDPARTPHPFGNADNIFQYQSEGIFKQNQFIVNSSIRLGAKLSLFGYYSLNYANSDTAGASSFPSISNHISLDYGRAQFDVRHRVFFGGTVGLPYAFRLSPFLIASSGIPFTITTGQDLNGDSIFNDRPAFATAQSVSVKQTALGAFDLIPQPGETIVPVNSLSSPSRYSLNLRVSKTIGFGKKAEAKDSGGGPPSGGTFGRGPGGGRDGFGGRGGIGGADKGNAGHRYNLTFGVSARNIFNHVNLASPSGNLGSPFFGRSNGLAGGPYSSSSANRRIDLQLTFTF